jgi:hypothetical protein
VSVLGSLHQWGATLHTLARRRATTEKRFIAAHFLRYVVESFDPEIRNNNIRSSDVTGFAAAWSRNVESAYTDVKFGSNRDQHLKMNVSKDGFGLEQGRST